ncbi:type II toxin-antitoxin system VapB family antitoxin [Kineococcus sp. T13]|nr:type II toxin-antitoxin system VapB family antitoxin [Kineococcus vitellinus]NAZ74305.1 type II toxin-antitoxin system VapB family antitoxin [Kineococcus vitellinus]
MTYTHIDIDDDLLGRAASALGTKQKKDTVEAALRAAVEKAEKDQAWSHLWDYVDAGGFSNTAYLEAEREHLAHEQAKVDEYAQRPGSSGSEGAA